MQIIADLALFESDDLLAVGELAALANRRMNADKVYFNVNRHINYTNICVNRCTFCAFSREDEADEGSYTLALNDILERAAEASDAGCDRNPYGRGVASRFAL